MLTTIVFLFPDKWTSLQQSICRDWLKIRHYTTISNHYHIVYLNVSILSRIYLFGNATDLASLHERLGSRLGSAVCTSGPLGADTASINRPAGRQAVRSCSLHPL